MIIIYNPPKNKFRGTMEGSHATKYTSSFKRKCDLQSMLTGESISVETILSLNDMQEEEVTINYYVFDYVKKEWKLNKTETFKL